MRAQEPALDLAAFPTFAHNRKEAAPKSGFFVLLLVLLMQQVYGFGEKIIECDG